MPLIDQIQKDIVVAMKAREEQRLSTLRMVKTALKNKEIDKMAPSPAYCRSARSGSSSTSW